MINIKVSKGFISPIDVNNIPEEVTELWLLSLSKLLNSKNKQLDNEEEISKSSKQLSADDESEEEKPKKNKPSKYSVSDNEEEIIFKQTKSRYEELIEYNNILPIRKGQLGELSVIDIIEKNEDFKHFIINNTTKLHSAADIQITINNIKIIIEVKNKCVISNEDIIKFNRDVKINNSVGIFISLKSLIPNRVRTVLSIDYVDGIPVVYCIPKTSNDITSAITLAEQLTKIDVYESENIYISQYKLDLIARLTDIDKEIKVLSNRIPKLELERKKIVLKLSKLPKTVFNKFDLIEEFVYSENRLPTEDECSEILNERIEDVIDKLRKYVLEKYITEDKKEIIKQHDKLTVSIIKGLEIDYNKLKMFFPERKATKEIYNYCIYVKDD